MFFVWVPGEDKLTQLLNELNNFHSNLKFACEISSFAVNFLDVNISLKNGAIHTDLYIKQTDDYQFLHYQSPNPLLIKKGFQNACFSYEGMVFSSWFFRNSCE